MINPAYFNQDNKIYPLETLEANTYSRLKVNNNLKRLEFFRAVPEIPTTIPARPRIDRSPNYKSKQNK